MKNPKHLLLLVLTVALVAIAWPARADEPKPKPYPLATCLVCGMKLDSMGAPYTFVYQGQEIKLCDQSERADFDKEPAKYLKQLAEAEARFKK